MGKNISVSGGREKKMSSWETLRGGRLLEEGGAGQRAQARYGPTIVSWLTTAGPEKAGNWEDGSRIREVGGGVGRKEVKPGELFFQEAELRGAESSTTLHRGGALSRKIKCDFRGWGKNRDREGLKTRKPGSLWMRPGSLWGAWL